MVRMSVNHFVLFDLCAAENYDDFWTVNNKLMANARGELEPFKNIPFVLYEVSTCSKECLIIIFQLHCFIMWLCTVVWKTFVFKKISYGSTVMKFKRMNIIPLQIFCCSYFYLVSI